MSAFLRMGFVEIRCSGSHHILRDPERHVTISVPVHGRKILKKGTLRALIRQSGKTIEDFVKHAS